MFAENPAERSPGRTLKLMVIGTAAGAFSGLFGVGGGSVIVPLLVLWLGYQERAATATSLAAIVCIAAFAAGTQGLYGNVNVRDALLVGVPAIAGVLFGTWLQQRVHNRAISLLFALVLIGSAVELVLR
ncbi:MAG TPA: sulfite exporter TauE/SafE family protein [Solirubrobacteraceae bacterium]|nr:sulfite exporter TauE/SafE family protein [Solirubrobacteraceae bacterium]